MPRIYDSTSSPLDFCQKDFPATEAAAFALYGNQGDGPDDRGNCFGYDEEHPPYDDDLYTCVTCRKHLTGFDDDAFGWPTYRKKV
jgi:hypothetical protein